ncbi:hypothetical protein [Acinetobacter johnsonii]|uniref:hypothetical protein n=1 Tax=Acinetobacter johnsonii TaxID=40214 RepID=UPI003AF8EDED
MPLDLQVKNNFLTVDKNNIQIFFSVLSSVFLFATGNFLFLTIIYLLFFSEIKKNIVILTLLSFITLFFLFLDPLSAKNFFFISTTIVLYSSKFSDYIFEVLKLYSYCIFLFLLYLLTLTPIYGEWSDVFNFKHRLWLQLDNGNILNPNPLGLLSAICALGFYLNKKFILMLVPLLFLILTQSRSAILFLAISMLFCNGVNLKKVLYGGGFLIILIYIVSLTPVVDRFKEEGENGRLVRFYYYKDELLNNFLTGMPYTKYVYMNDTIGSLDNMYLLSILKFGLFGVGLIVFWLIYFILNKRDKFYSIRFSLFLSFLVLGVFEGSIMGSFFTWLVFAMSFNSFSVYNLIPKR